LPKANHLFLRGFNLRPSWLEEFLEEHRKIEDLKEVLPSHGLTAAKANRSAYQGPTESERAVEAVNLRRKWSTIPKAAPALTKQEHFTINVALRRMAAFCFQAVLLNSKSRAAPRGNTKMGGTAALLICETLLC
jgi:hypothetical protein